MTIVWTQADITEVDNGRDEDDVTVIADEEQLNMGEGIWTEREECWAWLFFIYLVQILVVDQRPR